MTREARFQRSSTAVLGLCAIALVAECGGIAHAGPNATHATLTSPVATAPQAVQRYVQAGNQGAKIRNIPDPNGMLVVDAPAGEPLAVYEEKAGYLHVSAPGGYRVWVHGSLLSESGRPGWLELTGNQVNMRPEPRSQNSFPIGQLHKGDRVRMIGRADETKPMKDDWIEVWSPSTTQAWVATSETSALPAGSDGAALFGSAATLAAQNRGGSVTSGTGTSGTGASTAGTAAAATATAAGSSSKTDVFAALATAQALLRAAVDTNAVDFSGVRAAYAEVYLLKPDQNTTRIIERDLEQVKLHEDLIATRNELTQQRSAIEAENARQAALRREADLRKDPLWGRFESRGWLSSETVKGETRYIVSYAGDRSQIIECSSGRYDLALFVGFEVGVEGLLSGVNADAGLPTVDARTVEVISGRYRR